MPVLSNESVIFLVNSFWILEKMCNASNHIPFTEIQSYIQLYDVPNPARFTDYIIELNFIVIDYKTKQLKKAIKAKK